MVLKLAPAPLPVTERAVLNEANGCTTDRPLNTRPLSEERAFAFWQKDIPEAYWSLGGAAEAWLALCGAGAPLPARGHHSVRGLPRRLLQPGALGGRTRRR